MKNTVLLFVFISVVMMTANAQWSSDPSINNAISSAAGEQAIPKVKSTETGVTFFSWFSNESGNYNVRLQQLDLFGNPLWEDDGLLVSNHPAMTWLTDWDMTVDQEGHAILTFQDIRNGDNDVFAYRISPEGDFMWGMDGIEMSSGPAFDASPKVCVTNSGNAVFAWQAEDVILLQKISPEGTKLWGDNGITLSGNNIYSWPQLLAVGDDDVILKYFEDSGPVWAPTRYVFAQRYDSDGNEVWSDVTIVSNAGGISAWNQVFPFISDGQEGFYMAWHDDRDNDMHSSVFVQHINSEGDVLLGDDGSEASTQSGRQNFYPFLALPEDSEDIFVYWNEMDSDQNNRGISGQKISNLGERLWTDNGKSFIEISSTHVLPFSASSSGADMIVFYENYSSVIAAGVSAMRIDKEGAFVWEEQMIELCTVQSEKVHSEASTFVFGQWIACWEDDRNGNRDIYAQNIQLDGSLGSLPSVPSIEIIPDTLFIEENSMDYYIYIHNNSFVNYTLEDIHHDSEYWFIENLPDFPYDIEPFDTLTLYIPIYFVGSGSMGTGYEYDTLFIESALETNTSIVALNLDAMTGIANAYSHEIKVYPNPGNHITFEFNESYFPSGTLQILSATGQLLWQQDVQAGLKATWNGRNDRGDEVPNGIYFYQYIAEKQIQKGKIILSK